MSVLKDNNGSDVAIEVIDVKKKFKSYQDKASSFKERFINPSRTKHEDVWVLNGISFEVKKGEAIGLIGKNGCGKSTTLKLLTRILYPNEGQIKIKGRVSSLIELGAGFHPDMTGRENIYTNASIFGITRKEVDQRMEDIIRFSELEEFIDNPVRTYSSGMYMRLAFAVAINVDADVLLIDEILAVGDIAFQKKYFEKLEEIKRNGTTIVIVSHAMDQMYRICDRLIWIEKGLIKEQGVSRLIGEKYVAEMEGRRLDRIEHENQQKKAVLERKIAEEKELLQLEEKNKTDEDTHKKQLADMERVKRELEYNATLKGVCDFCYPNARRQGDGRIHYTRIRLVDCDGNETRKLITGKEYSLILDYEMDTFLEDIRFVMGITREDGIYAYGTYKECMKFQKKNGTIVLDFENSLLKGNYLLDLWIESIKTSEQYECIFSLTIIEVDTTEYIERGFFSMKHQWR